MLDHIYINEPLPEGYSGSVRMVANLTFKELKTWYGASLGIPGCEACAALRKDTPDTFCADCSTTRADFGASIVLIYGPMLLGTDVSTPEKALAAFDDDDWQPAEIVAWLYAAPDAIRERRTDALKKMLRSPSGMSEST